MLSLRGFQNMLQGKMFLTALKYLKILNTDIIVILLPLSFIINSMKAGTIYLTTLSLALSYNV